MKRWLIPCVILLMGGLYWVYFHIVGEFKKEDLGPLGDFIGGNINPLLTFVSTVLLIETVIIQRKAAEDAKKSEVEARKTIKQQSDLAAKQSFESSLFNLMSLSLEEYKNSSLILKSGVYQGSQAFSKYVFMFERLMLRMRKVDLLNQLEEYSSDALFDNLKNFSIVFKFINSYAPLSEKENYISLAITMMPTSLIQLLCVAHNHSNWPILASFAEAGVFERPSLQGYINYYA
ncbi:hypothetical protein [Pseudomonas lurida]|uniref:hypothetical protein n=1 Tax=Pseudomonas lurida TaxID=244566 RepID=UPI0034D96A7D